MPDSLLVLRKKVHEVIDPLWNNKQSRMFKNRADLYAYMASMLQIPPTHCHVSRMTEEDCIRTLKLFGVNYEHEG